jgi:hypothetical protein
MKRNSYLSLTICTVLGSAVAVTACHAAGSGAAGLSPSAGSPVTSASTAPTSAPSPARTLIIPPARPTISPPASPAPAAVTRVVANCAGAPDTLALRPKSIVIACADGNLGVKKMAWTRWGDSSATGRGTLYENMCQPNCAEGKFADYPVAVTLSTAKSSSQGAWFSELTVTWEGARPSNSTPDNFPLMAPR